jgi:hypothetical protein
MDNLEYEVLFDKYTDETLARIKLTSEKWNGIIYHYNTLNIREDGDEAVLTFDYDIVEAPGWINIDDLSEEDKIQFEKTIGDILVDIIETEIEAVTADENRTSDSEQSDL